MGPAAARARSLGAVEGVGAHGADGLRGWLPRGSARELARPTTRGGTGRDRVRSWRVIASSLRRGAYGESIYGRERRARTTGDSPSNARTEREHRPRARVSRRGWTERAGHGSRTAPARAREVAGKGRCERSGRTGRGSPWDEKGRHRRETPRRGYAMNGPVTHPMGRPSSPSPSMLNASSLRNMSTRARRRLGLEPLSFDQMKGRELFRWLTADSFLGHAVCDDQLGDFFIRLRYSPKGTSKSSNPPSAFAAASAAAPFSSDCERLSERRSCARANAAAPAGVSDERS